MTPKTTLTAAAVARFRPTATRREIPDGGMAGLSLLIHPSGKRSWTMRYRSPTNRAQMVKLTLGSVDISGAGDDTKPVMGGHLSLAAARRLAADVLQQRALGRDPAAIRRNAQTIATFGEAVTAYAQHLTATRRRPIEPARILGIEPDGMAMIPGGLAKRWAERPVGEVTADDLYAIIDEARRKGIPGQKVRSGKPEGRAHRMGKELSGLFGWLTKRRMIPVNVFAGIDSPPCDAPRERSLSDAEVRWFWSACETIGGPNAACLKTMLLTGAREREVSQMVIRELDGAKWTIPGERTKNGRALTLQLPPAVIEIIANASPVQGDAGWVFTNNGRQAINGFSKLKVAIDRAMLAAARQEAADPAKVTIQPWKFHDLRRTAVTGMARSGADLHVIERAVNHVSGSFGGIVATYQKHSYEDKVREALEAWALRVRSIVEPNNNVVMLTA